MYALHPGSLPPKDPLGKTRTEVTADDLVALYKLKSWEYIVWDPTDNYDWFDFIHLYPNYYGCYRRGKDGTPESGIPCATKPLGGRKAGGSSSSAAAISMRGKSSAR